MYLFSLSVAKYFMTRKLFCDINPTCYKISLEKEIIRRKIKDKFSKIIPGYMMPKVIKIIDKMPFNNNGKIDRKKLEELW